MKGQTAVQKRGISSSQTRSSPRADTAATSPGHVQLKGLEFAEQVEALAPDRQSYADQAPSVQMKGGSEQSGVHEAAAQGTAGSGGALPHLDTIQAAFGSHDVSAVQAYSGGAATEATAAMGAEAYATGDKIAFGAAPTIHTAAHEAAHVVQQRSGVSLSGGVGQAGDSYEQHADAVADAVVQGKSAEGLLDQMSGSGGGAAGVQKKDGDPMGLRVKGGLLQDWSVAVTHAYGRWRHIETAEKAGVQSWYKKVEKDDPPPMWQGLLKAALTIGLGAVTGGVGAVVVSKLASKASEFVINAAVEAGKGIIAAAGDKAASAAFEGNPSDPCYAFKAAQDETIQKVIEQKELTTSLKMDALARKGETEKWEGLQSIYDAIGGARDYAKTKAHDEALYSWLRTQAQKEYGQKGGVTDAAGLRDSIDTSSAGSIGLRMKSSSDPTKKLAVRYCEIESGKGNTEAVRKYLLASSTPIGQMRVPKAVLAAGMTGSGFLGGTFNLAFNEQGGVASSTYGGAMLDGSSDNAGAAWLAMYGMRTKSGLSEKQIIASRSLGLDRVRADVLGKTFKQLGITSIST
ncbi:MAG: hypothetical protein ACI9MR_002015 [Myxococcota bacterium]|jgi:hypothetical protein